MAVIKSKRNTSIIEYIHTARELCKYTISKCIGFAKRYRPFLITDLSDNAKKTYHCVISANNIYLDSPVDAAMRRKYLLEAKCALKCLVADLEMSQDIFKIQDNEMIYWMNLINKELSLVDGVLRSDNKKYNYKEIELPF